MKIIYTAKTFSYLRWPVNIGMIELKGLNITAKFFGQAVIDPRVVEKIIRDFDVSGLEYSTFDFKWTPEIFFGLAHVMRLTDYPKTFLEVHNLFEIFQDDFVPYKPHITLPIDVWTSFKMNGYTPRQVALQIGELELVMGNQEQVARND